MRFLLVLAAMLVLAGCASSPPRFDTSDIRDGLTPRKVADGADVFEGDSVLWGGTLVSVENREGSTLLQVLSYPLGSGQRPDTDQAAGDRFLVEYPGFLDPADYAPGRAVTVKGRVTGSREGQVGESHYRFAVLHGSDIELWPKQTDRARSNPSVNFGFGIILN